MAYGIAQAMMVSEQLGQGTSLINSLMILARSGQAPAGFGQSVSPLIMWGSLLILVVSAVCYGAIALIDRGLLEADASVSVGKALARSLGRLPAVVGNVLLYLLIMLVVTLCAAVAVGVLGFAFGMMMPWLLPWLTQKIGTVAAGGLLIGVALLLEFLPAIYLSIRWQLALAALFLDNAGPIAAFGVSWRLTRGRWWRGFAIVSVGLILIYLFALVFSFLGVGLGSLVPGGLRERLVVTSIVGQLASLVVIPAFVALYLAMYHDFKLRSQGGDLAARVGVLRQV
jgi:hypothetical protein